MVYLTGQHRRRRCCYCCDDHWLGYSVMATVRKYCLKLQKIHMWRLKRGLWSQSHNYTEFTPGFRVKFKLPLAAMICKPDLCNFVCNIEQYCTILAICTIYKNSCNMYNMYNINVNIVHKIACNIEQYGEQYYVQFWSICSIILSAISRNILCDITNEIALNIAQYCSILYITLLTILLTYCSIYFNIVHIAHIARVLINCRYCQYWTNFLDIVQNCSILLVATLVVINCTYCQYCLKLLIIVRYCSKMLAAQFCFNCSKLLAASMLAASMLQCCWYHWLSYYAMKL